MADIVPVKGLYLVNDSIGLSEFQTGETVPVANGGTGATTLTGLLVGNGTFAIASAVSGTDVKTINGTSILGSGDVTITGNAYSKAKTLFLAWS
jgi:hypothetical protein